MVTPLLEAENLVRRYGGRTVVDHVTLQVLPGDVLAIVGPNGAGKSTLFRLLLLLERPDGGTIRVGGADVRTRRGSAGRVLTGVFQRAVLFSGTVRQNVAYGLRVRGMPAAERERRVAAALEWLDLTDLAGVNVHDLSGGEARRVALTRALVTEPDVLLLDEPTAGLDASMQRRFRRDMQQVARHVAKSIVLITHDAADAFGVADRIAVMEAGRIAQLDTPERIMLQPATPFVAELTGAELLLPGTVELAEHGLYGVRLTPGVLLWTTAAAGAVLAPGMEAVAAYRPEDIIISGDEDDRVTSAVNRIPAQITAMVPAGPVVRVVLRTTGPGATQLTALLTRRSAETLSLSPGRRVTASIKATALHAWSRSA